MSLQSSRREKSAVHLDEAKRALDTQAIAQAINHLNTAMGHEPSWAEPHYLLARAMVAQNDRTAAERSVRNALEADPQHAAAAHLLGTLLCDRDRFNEALPWLQTAVAHQADNAAFHRDLGVLQLFCGDLSAARASLHRALDLDPRADSVLTTLVRMTQIQGGAPEAEKLLALNRELVDRAAELPLAEQIQVFFSLGKALEDLGDHDGAFEALTKGNRLQRSQLGYDGPATRARFASIAATFGPELFERLGHAGGVSSDRPIFILGMPRSGTTLVEQIISAHPQVFGAGEIETLHRLVGNARGAGGSTFPDWIAPMNHIDLRTIGQAYLDALPPGLPGQTRLTAKRLEDYQYIGLIHLCLPNAIIIHCHRDPLDCCFSAFATPFVAEQEFSCDLTELGTYWRAYHELMAHWRAVLPPGRILDVPYEGVVADVEGWTRRLLDHCRLDWDDACLRFYESKRLVRSASAAQVRRPIYNTSIGRWKPFAEHLRPLMRAMGEPWASLRAEPSDA